VIKAYHAAIRIHGLHLFALGLGSSDLNAAGMKLAFRLDYKTLTAFYYPMSNVAAITQFIKSYDQELRRVMYKRCGCSARCRCCCAPISIPVTAKCATFA